MSPREVRWLIGLLATLCAFACGSGSDVRTPDQLFSRTTIVNSEHAAPRWCIDARTVQRTPERVDFGRAAASAFLAAIQRGELSRDLVTRPTYLTVGEEIAVPKGPIHFHRVDDQEIADHDATEQGRSITHIGVRLDDFVVAPDATAAGLLLYSIFRYRGTNCVESWGCVEGWVLTYCYMEKSEELTFFFRDSVVIN